MAETVASTNHENSGANLPGPRVDVLEEIAVGGFQALKAERTSWTRAGDDGEPLTREHRLGSLEPGRVCESEFVLEGAVRLEIGVTHTAR